MIVQEFGDACRHEALTRPRGELHEALLESGPAAVFGEMLSLQDTEDTAAHTITIDAARVLGRTTTYSGEITTCTWPVDQEAGNDPSLFVTTLIVNVRLPGFWASALAIARGRQPDEKISITRFPSR